jgi:hypothetical protein
MRDLGLSAASRVAIGLDLVRTQREAVTLEELQAAMRRFANAALRYISPADREGLPRGLHGGRARARRRAPLRLVIVLGRSKKKRPAGGTDRS